MCRLLLHSSLFITTFSPMKITSISGTGISEFPNCQFQLSVSSAVRTTCKNSNTESIPLRH